MEEIVIEMANRLNRHRSLAPDEEDWVEMAVYRVGRANDRQPRKRKWQPAQDQDLLRHMRRGRTVHDIARAMGKTPNAIYSRICHLRRIGQLERRLIGR